MNLPTARHERLLRAVSQWLQISGSELNAGASDFIADVKSGIDLARWGSADFTRIFPFRPHHRGATAVHTARSAIIFLPILLTWWSLAHAVVEFSTLAHESPTETLNFIAFWQSISGFGRLSVVAYVDVAIIAITVLLSLLISGYYESPRRHAALQSAYDQMMVMFECELAGFRLQSPDTLYELSEQTYTNLRRASRRIARTGSVLDGFVQSSAETIGRLEGVVTRDFLPIAKRLEHVIAGLGSAVEMHSKLSSVVKEGHEALTSSVQLLDSVVSASVDSLHDSAKAQRDAIERAAADALDRFAQVLDTQTTSAVSTGRTLEQSLRDQVRSFETATNGIVLKNNQAAKELDKAVKGLSEQMTNVGESLQGIARSLEITVLHVRKDLNAVLNASRSANPA